MQKHVVGLGGDGFSEEDNLILEQYILNLTGKPRPKVCFLPTASGDSPEYTAKFYAKFGTLDCVTSHLTLPPPNLTHLRDHLLYQDVIHVGGGNTINMLALWRQHGLDSVMREAWEAGIVLSGISAGSICWFEQGVTDSLGPLSKMECLGIIRGSNCVHYDSQSERRPMLQKLVASGSIKPGFGTDEGVAVHYLDGALHKIISNRPDARAYYVDLIDGKMVETPHVPEYLGTTVS